MLPGMDIINIPTMTIILNHELIILSKNGIDTSIRINGAGVTQTIIDGNHTSRVFYFEARSGNHTISNLTIQNANNTSVEPNPNPYFVGSGGGIFNEAGLTLNQVTIKNCIATQGGGIFSRHAFLGNIPYLHLNGVTITNNQAIGRVFGISGGGGIYNGSLLSGQDVIITNNTAALQGGGLYHNSLESLVEASVLTNFQINNNTAVDAGGVDNDLGNINLYHGEIRGNVTSGCRVDGNCTYTGGAGIYNNHGTMNIEDTIIADNRAENPGGLGGGVYNNYFMTLTNVSITGNQAASGAGIFNGNYAGDDNHLTMTNATIGKNIGVSSPPIDAVGGGVYNTGNIVMINSTISENSAVVAGGIENKENIYISNTILAGNIAEEFSPDFHGKLNSLGSNILYNIEGCNFISQSSDYIGLDPTLGILTGKISYYPLSEYSQAIDTGSNTACPETDIRGVTRPQGSNCDIGSYEYTQLGDMVPISWLPLLLR